MIVDLEEPELFMRAILALLVLLPVGCKPDPPPPRAYQLDDITWAHPAMSALVERSIALVQTRHPDWVWVPLARDSKWDRIKGGLCPPEAVDMGVGIGKDRCTDEDHRLWLSLELPERTDAPTPKPRITDLWLYWNEDAPVAGGNVAAFFVVQTKDTLQPNFSDIYVTTSKGAGVYPDVRQEVMGAGDLDVWKNWTDLGHPLDEDRAGLSTDSYVGLELVDHVLRGAEQLQSYQIGRICWERDVQLGVQPFREGRTYEQFLLEVMPWLDRLPNRGRVDDHALYIQKVEAVRQERKEALRLPLSIAQTESESMYATLTEIIPADLVTELGLDSAVSAAP